MNVSFCVCVCVCDGRQVCIEMGFAAVALRYAFPVTVYAQNCATDSRGRSVTMQSISSSLKVPLAATKKQNNNNNKRTRPCSSWNSGSDGYRRSSPLKQKVL